MRKELIHYGGRTKEQVFYPQVRAFRKPLIVQTLHREGVRLYKDPEGRLHHADTFDRMFGAPGARFPVKEQKAQFSRAQKLH